MTEQDDTMEKERRLANRFISGRLRKLMGDGDSTRPLVSAVILEALSYEGYCRYHSDPFGDPFGADLKTFVADLAEQAWSEVFASKSGSFH
jgi:hypothetical protein